MLLTQTVLLEEFAAGASWSQWWYHPAQATPCTASCTYQYCLTAGLLVCDSKRIFRLTSHLGIQVEGCGHVAGFFQDAARQMVTNASN